MKVRKLLFVAAIYNWVIGLNILCYKYSFSLLGLYPIPDNPFMVSLFGGLVVVFGVGYYWASLNLEENKSILKLGVIGKLCVFFVCVANMGLIQVHWLFLLLAMGDLLFAFLFIGIIVSQLNGWSVKSTG